MGRYQLLWSGLWVGREQLVEGSCEAVYVLGWEGYLGNQVAAHTIHSAGWSASRNRGRCGEAEEGQEESERKSQD